MNESHNDARDHDINIAQSSSTYFWQMRACSNHRIHHILLTNKRLAVMTAELTTIKSRVIQIKQNYAKANSLPI